MLLLLVCTTLLLLLVWAWGSWLQTKRYWKDRGVPHLPPHPLLGSLTFIQKQNAALWMRDLYSRLRTPYIGLWLFRRPALLVNCPDTARRILVKDAAFFRDRFLSSGSTDPVGALNLFTVNEPLWSELRRRLSVMFTASKLRHLQIFIAAKSKELVQRVAMEMKENGRVDLRVMFTDYTTDVVGNTSFGIESDAVLTGASALKTVTQDFMQYSTFRGLAWTSIFFFPNLVDIFGFSLFPKNTVAYFRKVYREIVAQRGGYGVELHEAKDLIDVLRKIKRDYDKDGKEISEDTLIAQAAIFLQGGFDTTSSMLSFCTYEISFLPEFQEKLYNELCEVRERNEYKEFDPSSLNELVHLQCAMKETFRKYSPMGWLDRVAATDYQINDNLTVTTGTPVYVNALGLHYDPVFYPEPTKFIPDRFRPENERNIKPFTYLPFGEGPRACIGRRFGVQSFLTALSSIVLNYRIVPIENAKLPCEVEIEKKGIFITPGEKLHAVFVPRV